MGNETNDTDSVNELRVFREEYKAILGESEKFEARSLSELYQRIHEKQDQPLVALCLSGGGIRSATFCLGALQALASPPDKIIQSKTDGVTTSDRSEQSASAPEPGAPTPEPGAPASQPEAPAPSQPGAQAATQQKQTSQLERIHFLSTVSGGSYIGAWLSALLKRKDFDCGAVAQVLAKPEPLAAQGQDTTDPIAWLRQYSSYLAPRRGWSADTWSMIALYLRHLLINWFALVPLILAALLLPLVHLWALQALLDSKHFYPVSAYVHVELALFAVLTLRHAVPGRGGKPALDAGIALVAFALAGACAYFFLPLDLDEPEREPMFIAMTFVPVALIFEWTLGTVIAALSRASESEMFRERLTRDGGRAIALALVWFSLHALVFLLPSTILQTGADVVIALIAAGGIAGIAAALAGFWTELPATRRRRVRDRFSGMLLHIAAASFIVFFLGAGGSLLNMSIVTLLSQNPAPTAEKVKAEQPKGAAVDNFFETQEALTTRLGKFSKQPIEKKDMDLLQQEAQGELKSAARGVFDGVSTTAGRWLLRIEERLLVYAKEYRDGLQGLGVIVVCLFLGFGVFAVVAMWYLGVNTFSMTGFYGNRLIRAYLGASRGGQDPRVPDPYTGFDPKDDILMSSLCASGKCVRPFPVVNAALNLSRGSGLRWQQRKASSFTISPLHSGSWTLGYRPTAQYAAKNGLSLGKAVALSGAAVSPNMGYHTSPLIAFVLAFFNARLGFWLPNPGTAGKAVWEKSEPSLQELPLLRELLARTDDEKPFIYVSDGGHFDNLGLYEMVRRRCRRILVVDASSDPNYRYDDLAATLSKIRSDMGISIRFDYGPEPGQEPKFLFYAGEIGYPAVDGGAAEPGILVYVKPLLDDTAPLDVRRYARSHNKNGDRFPHQSTANQFFDEDQFESYRILGFHIMQRVLKCIGSLEARTIASPPVVVNSARNEFDADEPGMGTAGAAAPSSGLIPRFGAPVSGALTSWGSAGVLGVGLTLGGVVGVAGTVALAPGTTLSLAPGTTVPLAPDATVPLKGGSVTLDPNTTVSLDPKTVVSLAPNTTVSIDPKAAVSLVPNTTVSLTPGQTVGISGNLPPISIDPIQLEILQKLPAKNALSDDNLRKFLESHRSLENAILAAIKARSQERPSDAQLDALTKTLGRIDDKLETISKNTNATKDIATAISGVGKQLQEIGPRRSVIQGREGAR